MNLSELLNQVDTTIIIKDIQSEEELVLCLNNNFLQLIEGSFLTDEIEFDKLWQTWMFDEISLSHIMKVENCSISELFKINLYLSADKKSRNFEFYEKLKVTVREISLNEFNDYFDWGIYQVFIKDLSMSLEIDTTIGQRFYHLMDSQNPMTLAMETKEEIYLINYTGYI